MKKELSVLTSLLIARTSSPTLSDLMDPSGNHDIGTRTTVRWKDNEARELHFLLLRGSSKDKRLLLVSSEIMARQDSSGSSSPDLGIVVSQLQTCMEYYNRG